MMYCAMYPVFMIYCVMRSVCMMYCAMHSVCMMYCTMYSVCMMYCTMYSVCMMKGLTRQSNNLGVSKQVTDRQAKAVKADVECRVTRKGKQKEIKNIVCTLNL